MRTSESTRRRRGVSTTGLRGEKVRGEWAGAREYISAKEAIFEARESEADCH